jgi:hypothetical protein
MPTRSVEISTRYGRVCYESLNSKGQFITVECPIDQEAFRFLNPTTSFLHIGDWVRFTGSSRVQIISRKNHPEKFKKKKYYHEPYDGSNKNKWIYFDITDVVCIKIAPPDIQESLKENLSNLTSLSSHWNENLLEMTIKSLKKLTKMIEKINKNRDIKKFIDIPNIQDLR